MQNNMIICKVMREDVPKIVQMLADDFLGQQRERFTDPLPQSYYTEFEEIDSDKNNWLMVVKDQARVIGVFQLTFIPGLSYQGGKRALVEGVRVHQSHRGKGIEDDAGMGDRQSTRARVSYDSTHLK